MYSAATKMSYLTIINTGFTILLVDNGTGVDIFGSNWYTKSGSTICLTLIFTIFINTIVNGGFSLMYAFVRCYDRKWLWKGKDKEGKPMDMHTRKLTQVDYEEVNIGNLFNIHKRYNTLITYVFVTMIYSGGMPLLYPISAAYFFVTYWVDKYLLLTYYQKPPNFSHTMAKEIIYWFKWALFMHFISTSYMYAKPAILSTNPFMKKKYDEETYSPA